MTYFLCQSNSNSLGWAGTYFIEKPSRPYQRTDRFDDITLTIKHFNVTNGLTEVPGWDENERVPSDQYDVTLEFTSIDSLYDQLPELFL